MKTIDVFILQIYEGEGIGWVNCKLATTLKEAKEWFALSDCHDFEHYKLTLPQEIQVQSDY